MANKVYVWQTGSNILLWSASIGSGTAATGIYHDGHTWWIVDGGGTGTIQGYRQEGSSFYQVASYSLSGVYDTPTAITGDGQNLIVSCTENDPGPPATAYHALILVDPVSGTILKKIKRYATGTDPGSTADLGFDGEKILDVFNNGTTLRTGRWIERDPGLTVSIMADTARQMAGGDSMGNDVLLIAQIATSYFPFQYTKTGTFLKNWGSIGTTVPYGACFIPTLDQQEISPGSGLSQTWATVSRA